MRVAGIYTLLVLSACTGTPEHSVTLDGPACPAVIAWSAAEQVELRKEYDALAPNAALRKAFRDYIALRDAARTCAAKSNSR
jgi:hypothetical protein